MSKLTNAAINTELPSEIIVALTKHQSRLESMLEYPTTTGITARRLQERRDSLTALLTHPDFSPALHTFVDSLFPEEATDESE